MPNTKSPTDALSDIMKQSGRVISEESMSLFANLKMASPVKTGMFKKSWVLQKKSIDGMKWRISNPLEYASILYDGRRVVNGRAYGSEQWLFGGSPMLERTNIAINAKLKRIRA